MPATAPPTTVERTRERRKLARRDAILAAARKVFAQKRFDGATIADIAREAGVASGTVYLYYASKVDLFAALYVHLFQLIYRAVQEAQVPGNVRGDTRARIHTVFEAAGRNRDLLRLVYLNPDPQTEVARRLKHAEKERLRPLAELVRGGMAAGTIQQGDPILLARIIDGLVTIALYQCFVQGKGREVQAYEDTVTDMIVGALTPQ